MANRLSDIRQHLSISTAMPETSQDEFLKEYIFFGHDTVNRVSFLRDDDQFIKSALNDPNTRIVIFNQGVVYGFNDDKGPRIGYLKKSDIGNDIIDEWIGFNASHDIGINDGILVTFLGLDERQAGMKYKLYGGVAYFAIDISRVSSLVEKVKKLGLVEISDRKDIFELNNFDSSTFSHGKMYLDWLLKTKFCAGCGKRTIPIQSGTKLMCSSSKEENCPIKTASVSNISFPRTDAVIITAITTKKFDKILLGRGKRFPGPMYSCIAGFVEPSESIEVAALREVWEETGVKPNELMILKTQPWPYPANLMIGCIAFVEENGVNEVIHLGHDPELLDAKWFDIHLIKDVMEKKIKSDFFLPPKTAIAQHLIEAVVKKYEELNK